MIKTMGKAKPIKDRPSQPMPRVKASCIKGLVRLLTIVKFNSVIDTNLVQKLIKKQLILVNVWWYTWFN